MSRNIPPSKCGFPEKMAAPMQPSTGADRQVASQVRIHVRLPAVGLKMPSGSP